MAPVEIGHGTRDPEHAVECAGREPEAFGRRDEELACAPVDVPVAVDPPPRDVRIAFRGGGTRLAELGVTRPLPGTGSLDTGANDG
jgi:hypothetical protein